MKDAGIVVLSAFVSPYRKDRAFVKTRLEDNSRKSLSVHLSRFANVETSRVVRQGTGREISNFTGINAPFETPLNPALDVPTHEMNIEEATDMVVQHTIKQIALNHE